MFDFTYCDAAGEEKLMTQSDRIGLGETPGCFRLELGLEEDPGEFVVLRPQFSHRWEAEEAVRVKVSLQ